MSEYAHSTSLSNRSDQPRPLGYRKRSANIDSTMSHSGKTAGEFPGPRFRLRTLMLLVAMCGVVVAWISDRRRLDDQNRQLLSANRAQEDQIVALKQRLETRTSAIQIVYWWASADEFIEMLKTSADENAFLERAPSLAGADQAVIDDAVQKLISLLKNQDETTTERALTSLRFTQEMAPVKLESHAPSIVSAVLPLLNSSSDRIAATSIGTLESFGPMARDAIPPLSEIMNDDSEWMAPAAAVAIAEIEPGSDVGPRLVELVKMKHPNWYHAAFHLPRFVEEGIARRVLNGAFEDAQSESDRKMATNALNQIPAKEKP